MNTKEVTKKEQMTTDGNFIDLRKTKVSSQMVGQTIVGVTKGVAKSNEDSSDAWKEDIIFESHPETLTVKDIMTKPEYKDTVVYKLFKQHKLTVDSDSIFVLHFDKKYALPKKKKEFALDEIDGFGEYTGFKVAKGNRVLEKKYVDSFAERLEEHVYAVPCMVDVYGTVIDGQNRMAGAMKAGRYVYVEVVSNPTKEMVLKLNEEAHVWKSDNKIDYYREHGSEDYEMLTKLMHKFDNTTNEKYKPYADEINPTRNGVGAMANPNMLWHGQCIKDIMDSGNFQIDKATYQKISDYLDDYYADCIVHLRNRLNECIERDVIAAGYSIKKGQKKFMYRSEFLQLSLYKLMNLVNAKGERLGDNSDRLKAFISSLNVVADIDEDTSRLLGFHLQGTNALSQHTCGNVAKDLVILFDRWNKNVYFVNHRESNRVPFTDDMLYEPAFDVWTEERNRLEREEKKRKREAKRAVMS